LLNLAKLSFVSRAALTGHALEYRLFHFNCNRLIGSFTPDNPAVTAFLSVLPRIFADADAFDGLYWHGHGVRCPNGSWRSFIDTFPYPEDWEPPEISTIAAWRSLEHLKAFSHNGRTHPPGMRRLQGMIDRDSGARFVMWWAQRGQRFTLEDGWQRLLHLRARGSTPFAFSIQAPVACPMAA
jgi:hypothetical protein